MARARRGNKRAELTFTFATGDAGNWLVPLRPAELGTGGKIVRAVFEMLTGNVTGTFDFVVFNGPYDLPNMVTADIATIVTDVHRRVVYATGASSSAPDETDLRATPATYAAHASSNPADDAAAETVGVSIKAPATVTTGGTARLVLYAEDCD